MKSEEQFEELLSAAQLVLKEVVLSSTAPLSEHEAWENLEKIVEYYRNLDPDCCSYNRPEIKNTCQKNKIQS